MRLPLHGLKNAMKGGKLLFPHLREWREMTLFSEELRLGETQGLYEYEPIDGIAFRRGPVLKETMEKLFALKSQAKAEGKGAKEKAVKIIANSTYGFFGQRTEDRENLKIYRSGDVPVYDYLSRNALIEEAACPGRSLWHSSRSNWTNSASNTMRTSNCARRRLQNHES